MDKNENKLTQVAIRLVEQPPLYSDKPIKTPEDAIRIVGKELSQLDREALCLVNLKADGTPINFNIVSIGTLNMSLVHPREILKTAILSNAANMILLHNHPSGSLKPSVDDIQITNRLAGICREIDIPLLDHIIFGPGNEKFFSFLQKDIMPVANNNYLSELFEVELNRPKISFSELEL